MIEIGRKAADISAMDSLDPLSDALTEGIRPFTERVLKLDSYRFRIALSGGSL